MFSLTSAAARQIQKAAGTSGAQAMVLRVAATVDADGTIQYGMGFDEPNEGDLKLNLEGVAVVIAEPFQQVLSSTVLDFVEMEEGVFNFIFVDAPETQATDGQANAGGCATSSCGGGACGGGSRQGCGP